MPRNDIQPSVSTGWVSLTSRAVRAPLTGKQLSVLGLAGAGRDAHLPGTNSVPPACPVGCELGVGLRLLPLAARSSDEHAWNATCGTQRGHRRKPFFLPPSLHGISVGQRPKLTEKGTGGMRRGGGAGRNGAHSVAGNRVCTPLVLTENSRDPRGWPGSRRVLQSCTRLRQLFYAPLSPPAAPTLDDSLYDFSR